MESPCLELKKHPFKNYTSHGFQYIHCTEPLLLFNSRAIPSALCALPLADFHLYPLATTNRN